jgi:hypothetical protein
MSQPGTKTKPVEYIAMSVCILVIVYISYVFMMEDNGVGLNEMTKHIKTGDVPF